MPQTCRHPLFEDFVMAQTAPTPPADGSLRPLPRGGRTSAKNTRPRFQPIDAAWMAGMGVLFVGLSAWTLGLHNGQWPGTLAGAATILLTYLLGWRASGRVAGIIGALLLATSVSFASSCPADTGTAIFTLLAIASLFAFVAGSSLAALGLAALTAGFRVDGALLGLILLALTIAQHRQRAWLGALLFVLLTIGALWVSFHTQGIPAIALGMDGSLWRFLLGPSVLFLLWFLLPFCGELADPIRRARWLPVVLWTLLSLALGVCIPLGHGGDAQFAPLLPLLFVLIGGGLARLMPALGGEFPAPAVRYVLATLAVVSLVGLRAQQEWPLWHATPASAPMQADVPAVPTAPAPPVMSAPRIAPKQSGLTAPRPSAGARPAVPVKKPHPATIPHANVAPPATPPVPLYHIVNGRRVKRSTWAIQWDMTHPHP